MLEFLLQTSNIHKGNPKMTQDTGLTYFLKINTEQFLLTLKKKNQEMDNHVNIKQN